MTSMSLARCGKLLELCVLLMVAWEKLLNKANADESPPLERCMKEELQWTFVEKAKMFSIKSVVFLTSFVFQKEQRAPPHSANGSSRSRGRIC
ncbi:unnamed protein product [Cuscuta campestris]|uniref:Secreted protein n=1 Tax=Cuscuta campestris TaxID=132261 RepID=A0A484N0E1_9ASTE|nr:unnamed protein product [Cuscuta campestris]